MAYYRRWDTRTEAPVSPVRRQEGVELTGSTTNTNVFLRYDYFYIALSSVVLPSKQILYENKKK
jgi:hypothetical protein